MEIKWGNRAHQLPALFVPCPSETAETIVRHLDLIFSLSPSESQGERCCLDGGEVCSSGIHTIQVTPVLLEGQTPKSGEHVRLERNLLFCNPLKLKENPKWGEDLHYVLIGQRKPSNRAPKPRNLAASGGMPPLWRPFIHLKSLFLSALGWCD